MNLRTTFHPFRRMAAILLCVMSAAVYAKATNFPEPVPRAHESVSQLSKDLNVGDVVFIHVSPLPFEKVSAATQSWVNHVGIVVNASPTDPVIAESTFPFSRTTTLSRFTQRSQDGRVAIARLNPPLTEPQRDGVRRAARHRLGIFYDTGFNLNSPRQFCSRFVREVLADATGVTVGEVQTFRTLLQSNPDTDIGFWRLWYLGRIPWERTTVTPASLLHSDRMNIIFDGFSESS